MHFKNFAMLDVADNILCMSSHDFQKSFSGTDSKDKARYLQDIS